VADVLQFLYRAWIWFVYRTFQISPPSPRNFLWGHLNSTVYESNPHTMQELKYNISHTVAAITITMLHPVYLNMIRRAQLCIDAGGNHLQHLLWWYILSAFGYCINFCIYAMLQTRATFSWHILYYKVTFSWPTLYNRRADTFVPNVCPDFKREMQKLKLILLYHRSEVGNSAKIVDRRREKYGVFLHFLTDSFVVPRGNICVQGMWKLVKYAEYL